MKKIKLLITILFMIMTFVNPEMIKRVNADTNPYALITTIYDDEDNGSFRTAINIEENQTSIYSSNYKNEYVAGTISSSSDEDYYCLNAYGESNIILFLTMYDQSNNDFFEYNFKIYRQKNISNPSLDIGGMELICS